MDLLRCIIPLLFATITALGQLAEQSKPPNVPTEPGAVVRSLYSEVVARHPVGIPGDADMKIFAPYLSKALLHRIDLAIACSADEARQHPDPHLKPEIAWLEFGLFTGGMENAAPGAFHVLATEPKKNGSFRVFVELIIMYGLPANPEPSVWYVAAIVVRENGQFVVDEVIFLKDYSTLENEFRLSEVLSAGCNGPRWVGYGLGTGAAPTTPDKVDHPGTEWLAWSAAEREVYVRGFIFGYGNGSEAACKLADDLFEVGKHHRVGEGPRARCENRVKQYTKIKMLDSGFDFGAYTSVITDFYTKHPEHQNVSETYLLSLLSDQDYKSGDQFYQIVLKGLMTNRFPPP